MMRAASAAKATGGRPGRPARRPHCPTVRGTPGRLGRAKGKKGPGPGGTAGGFLPSRRRSGPSSRHRPGLGAPPGEASAASGTADEPAPHAHARAGGRLLSHNPRSRCLRNTAASPAGAILLLSPHRPSGSTHKSDPFVDVV